METNYQKSGPCMHCELETNEGKFWFESDDDDIPDSWVFVHDECKKISAIKSEDIAMKKHLEDPDNPTKKFIAELMTRMCDHIIKETNQK